MKKRYILIIPMVMFMVWVFFLPDYKLPDSGPYKQPENKGTYDWENDRYIQEKQPDTITQIKKVRVKKVKTKSITEIPPHRWIVRPGSISKYHPLNTGDNDWHYEDKEDGNYKRIEYPSSNLTEEEVEELIRLQSDF